MGSEVTRDMGAGLVAGSIKTIALHPFDTLTCRGQVGRAQLDLIWPRPQVAVLYGGLSPAIMRSAGGMAIWLSVRNSLERNANSIESLQGSPWLRDWLVGMASTAFTDLCTFPLDTLEEFASRRRQPLSANETTCSRRWIPTIVPRLHPTIDDRGASGRSVELPLRTRAGASAGQGPVTFACTRGSAVFGSQFF